jgi:hypothetical protein
VYVRNSIDNRLRDFFTSAFSTWLSHNFFPDLISTLHFGAATLKKIRFFYPLNPTN